MPSLSLHKSIPKPRGKRAQLAALLPLGISLAVLWCFWSDLGLMAEGLLLHMFCQQLTSLIRSVCYLFEEHVHVHTRYQGSYRQLLRACLSSKCCLYLLLLPLPCYLYFRSPQKFIVQTLAFVSFFQALYNLTGFKDLFSSEISVICEERKFYVAHGLAWAYYIGYLRLILPGLRARIQRYNELHNNILCGPRSHRLYILFPLDCGVPDNLSVVDPNIRFLHELPSQIADRAGIIRRVYTNSVYEIWEDGEPVTACVLEYATALQTLFAMSHDSRAGFSQEDRQEQAKLFCRTLGDILNEAIECQDNYSFIIYQDSREGSCTLSQRILQHLRKEQEEVPVGTARTSWVRETTPTLSQEPQLLISDTEDMDQPLPLRSDI